jgi:hypothetical protein
MYQALSASPSTAHIDAMFRPASVVRDAARAIATRMAVPQDWVQRSVRDLLGAGARLQQSYLELSHLRVFAPLPEYVLAMKCAAMRLGEDFREMDDIRYVLRAMNVASAEEALGFVTRYFTERQLPADTRERLSDLLGS